MHQNSLPKKSVKAVMAAKHGGRGVELAAVYTKVSARRRGAPG
jgi:hypothetical protein